MNSEPGVLGRSQRRHTGSFMLSLTRAASAARLSFGVRRAPSEGHGELHGIEYHDYWHPSLPCFPASNSGMNRSVNSVAIGPFPCRGLPAKVALECNQRTVTRPSVHAVLAEEDTQKSPAPVRTHRTFQSRPPRSPPRAYRPSRANPKEDMESLCRLLVTVRTMSQHTITRMCTLLAWQDL